MLKKAIVILLVMTFSLIPISQSIADRWVGMTVSPGVSVGNKNHRYMVYTLRFFRDYLLTGEKFIKLYLRGELLFSSYSGYFWEQTGNGWNKGPKIKSQELGFVPSLVLEFGNYDIRPYLEGGAGLTYNSVDTRFFSPGINIRTHIGTGLKIRMTNYSDFIIGGRFSHVSNAGTRDRNSGLNFIEFLIGMSFSI